MFPDFKIGGLVLYTYGLCMQLAIAISLIFFLFVIHRKKYRMPDGVLIFFISLIAGFIGSKIFYYLENTDYYKSIFELFRPDTFKYGFTFSGFIIFVLLFTAIYCRIRKISILPMFDIMAPIILISYSIMRLGCHLSGDGDYGIIIPKNSSLSFLGVSYERGTIPTPPGVLVHPTPIYEIIVCLAIFWYIWKKREHWPAGKVFCMFLILVNLDRLLVGFIMPFPSDLLGMTYEQIISFLMIAAGLTLFQRIKRKENESLVNS
ncbi:MAG: prolipoprotein diacylglyceryl transferase [Ignavibacteria bacterium]|jgi:phosphatidylglycerol:prolipoprotein diacylglycerol transferase|nr:prolipoprotein diacylglyceryl transferase [Ignavibacteria bacterium]